MRIATWNLKWAKPGGKRYQACLERLEDLNPDVICLTEAYETALESFTGFSISSDPDFGYPLKPGRRKVVLWSRWPLELADNEGSSNLPGGRFVAGKIKHEFSIDFIAVCIPWSGAHVSTGRKDRKRWQDQLLYLDGLMEIERFNQPETNTVVFGDFNHRASGKFSRKDVHQKFKHAFRDYEILTGDLNDTDGRSSIDHIGVQGNLAITDRGVISRFDDNEKELTDHFGVWCDLEPATTINTSIAHF